MKNTKISKSFFIKTASLVIGFALLCAPLFNARAATLTRQLQFGMSGSDVSSLQEFLARDSSIYPEAKVTGYFGTLTRNAVMNFQIRNNISVVGRVGPMTLIALNAQMSGMSSGNGGYSATISGVNVAPGRTSAVISWNTNEAAKGIVYYSVNPLTTYEYENSVSVSGDTAMTDTSLRYSQNISIQNLNPNTTYHYLVYTTDQDGNVSVTGPLTFKTLSN